MSSVTAVVPVSVIPSHPDITIITETILSVRYHFPTAEIIITFDGVRDEQAHRRQDYEQHINRVLWEADHVWGNITPHIFETHHHQSGMLNAVLDTIRTPLLMYVEQDTPIVCDEPINWDMITTAITDGTSNLVRLYHEAAIPEPHTHLMHGHETTHPLIRTSQWSQRPHVASCAYYRRIMDAHFTARSTCFIEDKMHSVLDQSYRVDGTAGWLQHRTHIYNPGPNMKRSYHTDGRAGETKYGQVL